MLEIVHSSCSRLFVGQSEAECVVMFACPPAVAAAPRQGSRSRGRLRRSPGNLGLHATLAYCQAAQLSVALL